MLTGSDSVTAGGHCKRWSN